MYTAYVLTPKSKKFLLKKFPPKHERVLGDHVTMKFGVKKDTPLPPQADLKVVGYIEKDGLEALVVSVNGKINRPDGSRYHITWSLDPSKHKPKDSNDLLASKEYTLKLSTVLYANPQLLD